MVDKNDLVISHEGFPGGPAVKTACSAADVGSALGGEDPLEKQTAVHSSILAWEIPWTEEPGRQQAVVSEESDTA